MGNVNIFKKEVKSHGQGHVFQSKGLVIRNTHAKYESSVSYGKRVIGNVKIFKSKSSHSEGHMFQKKIEKIPRGIQGEKSRKDTASLLMITMERSCHKEHTCQWQSQKGHRSGNIEVFQK